MLLVHDTFQVLSQLITVVQQLHKEEFCRPIKVLSGQSIGSHVRHVVEFYSCLLDGVKIETVDYDARKRDLSLERDPAKAMDMLEKIICTIVNHSTDVPMTLRIHASDSVGSMEVVTSYFRELSYNIEHVIHHLALIRIALEERFPTVVIPENFGVAFSTIQYRASCAP
jgi:uncharacterized damage-inducible protein DinB